MWVLSGRFLHNLRSFLFADLVNRAQGSHRLHVSTILLRVFLRTLRANCTIVTVQKITSGLIIRLTSASRSKCLLCNFRISVVARMVLRVASAPRMILI